MARTVHCVKLNEDLEGLDAAPIRGEMGDKIYNTISKKAWNMWIEHSKMIVNEYRLSMASPDARAVMRKEMEKFLFGEGAAPPPDFKPQQ
ncbi:MAG: oxidative damage protection protein [Deltaproteobacteria bacterium]|nr:oxidative damage protection protein [Deltaproteobacteria bacterium]